MQATEKRWAELLEEVSQRAFHCYQSLVYGDPDFLTYFQQATPINVIGELNIGSRPARRKASARIQDLRAIPWVFSWTQSRHLLPAWFGFGTAMESLLNERPEALAEFRRMYRHWPFFKALIDNLHMALAKADMLIAAQYASLVEDKAVAERLFRRIEDEYRRTCQAAVDIAEQPHVLAHSPVIRESIRLRNPYVDALSFFQVLLLEELRERRRSGEDTSETMQQVLLTINGIASGLRNTG
jgi:phosphoenolpyruvate carboxylase